MTGGSHGYACGVHARLGAWCMVRAATRCASFRAPMLTVEVIGKEVSHAVDGGLEACVASERAQIRKFEVKRTHLTQYKWLCRRAHGTRAQVHLP